MPINDYQMGQINATPFNHLSIEQPQKVYLPWEKIIPTDPIRGPTIIGLLVFFSYAIVANTVVPISLYVSVEVN